LDRLPDAMGRRWHLNDPPKIRDLQREFPDLYRADSVLITAMP
jgi:hypothetical protein